MIEFSEWKVRWWKEQAFQWQDVSSELAEGLRAFAEEQADMEVTIANRFASQWAPVRRRALPVIDKFWGTKLADIDVVMGDIEEVEIVEFLVGEEDDNDGGGSDFEE